MLYLGVSQTHEAQLNILQALTRKFKLHPALSLQRIAEACPFHYTGADFYALCSDALLKAMSRKAEELEEKIGTRFIVPHLDGHTYLSGSYNQRKPGGSTTSVSDNAAVLPCGDGLRRRRGSAGVPG